MEDVTMNKILNIIGAFLILIFSSCSENERMVYEAPGKVYFFERIYVNASEKGVSEKSFSFALQNSALMVDTFKIKVKLMGNLADVDRSFKAEVVADSSTAIAGTHYKLLEGVMPAGQYMSYLPVILYRTSDTKDKSVTIKLKINANGDLLPGNIEFQNFKLNWGDVLLKPDNWPEYFFGVYSKNKYRFAIDVLGLTDWPMTARVTTEKQEGIYTISEVQAFTITLNEAYIKYRAVHGPIYVDDNAENKEEIYYGQK